MGFIEVIKSLKKLEKRFQVFEDFFLRWQVFWFVFEINVNLVKNLGHNKARFVVFYYF